ncbi:MAG: ribose 5-phosphate isomerase B [Planctomycetota bacterium]|jgi:RpiB/LacA/LacB family sugar-phosphate isomerase
MKIILGSDHRGHELIEAIAAHLEGEGYQAHALAGGSDGQACDYPDQAYMVATAVASGLADRGVLVCGSGIGMSMAANKVDGVRAALVADVDAAVMSRKHNDANVLCLAATRVGTELACTIASAWLAEAFEGGRHERRVEKMAAIERGEDPAEMVANA